MNLKQIRESRGLTQKQVAEICNLSQAAIHKLESGKIKPIANITSRLIKCLNLKITGDGEDFEDPFDGLSDFIAEVILDDCTSTSIKDSSLETNWMYEYNGKEIHIDATTGVVETDQGGISSANVYLRSVALLGDEGLVTIPVSEEAVNRRIRELIDF